MVETSKHTRRPFLRFIGWGMLLLVALVFTFRKPLILFGAQCLLQWVDSPENGREVRYSSIRWEKDLLLLSQLSVQTPGLEMAVEEVAVSWKIHWSLFRFEPQLALHRPQIVLNDQLEPRSSSLASLLIPHSHFKASFAVEQGVLSFADQALYFSLCPGEKWESIGTLTCAYDPDPVASPLLTTELHRKEETLAFSFYLQEKNLSQISSLWSFFPFTERLPWQPESGSIEVTGSGVWDSSFSLDSLSCHGILSALSLSHRSEEARIFFESLEGSLTYPTTGHAPFWEKIEAELTVTQGTLALSASSCLEVSQATCHLQKQSPPELSLEGEWRDGDLILPICLEGKGGIHADGAFWIELAALSQREEKVLFDVDFSCCSPTQDHYILQVDCSQADLKCVHSFHPSFFSTLEGALRGKVVLQKTAGTLFCQEDWELMECDLFLGDVTAQVSSFPFQLSGHLCAQDGQWLPSEIRAAAEGVLAEVHIHPPQDEAQVAFSLSGNFHSLLKPYLASSFDPLLLQTSQMHGTIYSEKEGIYCQGILEGEQTLSYRLHFSPFDWQKNTEFPRLLEGWVRAEAVHETIYAPWVALVAPELELQGALSLFARITPDQWDISLEGKQLVLDHPQFRADAVMLDGTALFSYHPDTGQWLGHLPLKCSSLTTSFLELSLNQIKGEIQLKGRKEGVEMQGTLAHFSLPLTDQITFEAQNWKWGLSSQRFVLLTGKGALLHAQGDSYPVDLHSLEISPNSLSQASLTVQQGNREIARLQGKLKGNALEWTAQLFSCPLDPFLTKPLPMGGVSGTVHSEISWEKEALTWTLSASSLKWDDNALSSLQVKGKKIRDEWTLEASLSDALSVQAAFSLDPETIQFSRLDGKGKGITFSGKGVYQLAHHKLFYRIDSLHGHQEKNQIRYHLSANTEWQFYPLSVKGEATAALDLSKPFPLIAKSERPVSFSFSPSQGLQANALAFNFYMPSTFQHLGRIEAAALNQKGDRTKWYQGKFSLSPTCVAQGVTAGVLPGFLSMLNWDSYLEGGGEGSVSPEGILFDGTLKEGHYGTKQITASLEQVLLSVTPQRTTCRFKTHAGSHPIWGQVQVDLSAKPYGAIKLVDHPESKGLTAWFKTDGSDLLWDKIEGELLGAHLRFSPASKRTLRGTLFVTDPRCLALLPSKLCQSCTPLHLGGGYEFTGDINLNQFEIHGNLRGENFELFGFLFEHLEARLDATSDCVWISQLQLDDPAGHLMMKKSSFNLASGTPQWKFQIPLIQIKEWRPSLLRKKGEMAPEVKPFVIKNLSLTDLHGDLSNPPSWEGTGQFNFLNAFKKETSFLDIPLDIIKNLGLDPGLLTPIQGEVDVELRGDKFYLTHLKNAFSEAKRSQFFLAVDQGTSYIGLDGKLHIDLSMRQDVLLKITEAFTLKIRGSVDKPKYGF